MSQISKTDGEIPQSVGLNSLSEPPSALSSDGTILILEAAQTAQAYNVHSLSRISWISIQREGQWGKEEPAEATDSSEAAFTQVLPVGLYFQSDCYVLNGF